MFVGVVVGHIDARVEFGVAQWAGLGHLAKEVVVVR